MADVDPIGALISVLRASGDVAAQVADRVFGQEIPSSESASMPRKSVVLRYSGRGSLRVGSTDWVRWESFRMDVFCYGKTFYEADNVRREVHPILRKIGRKFQGISPDRVLISSCNFVAGPIAILDRDTGWPFFLETYNVLHAADAVT